MIDLETFINMMGRGEEKSPPKISVPDQIKRINKFRDLKNDIKIGDIVVLNEYGEKVLKLPKEGTVGIVDQIFEYQISTNKEETINCVCLVTIGEAVVAFKTDTRYFKKWEEPRNIFSFRKNKNGVE